MGRLKKNPKRAVATKAKPEPRNSKIKIPMTQRKKYLCVLREEKNKFTLQEIKSIIYLCKFQVRNLYPSSMKRPPRDLLPYSLARTCLRRVGTDPRQAFRLQHTHLQWRKKEKEEGEGGLAIRKTQINHSNPSHNLSPSIYEG